MDQKVHLPTKNLPVKKVFVLKFCKKNMHLYMYFKLCGFVNKKKLVKISITTVHGYYYCNYY